MIPACLTINEDARVQAKRSSNVPPTVAGFFCCLAIMAWMFLGYDLVFMLTILLPLTGLAWVYHFGMKQGAAYIPTDSEVLEELKLLMQQNVSETPPTHSLRLPGVGAEQRNGL